MHIESLPNNVLQKYLTISSNKRKLKSKTPDIVFTEMKSPPYVYWKIIYKTKTHYVKIFHFPNTNFVNTVKYNEAFIKAVKENFYKDITLMTELIYDQNNIVGYIYPILNKINKIDTNKLSSLMKKTYEISKKTNLVFTDLTNDNIMTINNNYYIIDLESITFLNIYKNTQVRSKHFRYNNKQYEKLILAI